MSGIDRTPFRTYVYLAALLYFAVIGVAGALDFLFAELGMGSVFPAQTAAKLDSLRLFFMGLMMPLARAVFRFWPEAASLMLRWPFVSTGVILLSVALLFFSAFDFVKSALRK